MVTSSRPEIDHDLVVQLTQDLVRFQSVNPPGNEMPVAQFLGQRMTELGFEVEVQDLGDERANVIGRVRGQGEGHLVFTGHLDVVPPGAQAWERDPFSADVANGKLYGRGSCDMKGGVAAIVTAVAALIKSGFKPKADLVVACTAGEESGMMGALAMVERRSLQGSRYLVVAEPSDLKIFRGEKGVFWLRIRALGQTAHGSMPGLGINAVSYMARLITRLEEYPFPWIESPLLGGPTISVNVISGGNKINVVPDVCEIEVDMRTVPSQDHEKLLTSVRELAQEVAQRYDPRLKVEIAVDNDKQALETDTDDPLIHATVESVRSVMGEAPDVVGVTFGTDAAYLSPGFGIPMVICGPGVPGMAHQPNESVDTDQLIHAAEIYTDLAQRLLG